MSHFRIRCLVDIINSLQETIAEQKEEIEKLKSRKFPGQNQNDSGLGHWSTVTDELSLD